MAHEHGPKSAPSLLAGPGPAAEASTGSGILANLEGRPAPSRKATAGGRGGVFAWLLPALGCGVLAIAVWIATGTGAGDPRAPEAVAEAAPVQAEPVQAARVFDEPPPLLVPVSEPAEATVADGHNPLQALLDGGETTSAPPPRTAPRRPRPAAVPAASADSDVDLLAALMVHASPRPAGGGLPVRDGTATASPGEGAGAGLEAAHQRISVRLAACPAANTAEGLTCRQQACSEGWGEHPSCPEPARRALPAR